jgi:response regulator RpfG family c-di-GMP phosphodiesterase
VVCGDALRTRSSELLTVKESAGRILYVEDDEVTRELFTSVMTMNNYRIAAAEKCDDALMLVSCF